LATRDLIDGENFPRVARADFFDTQPSKPFTSIPDAAASRIKHGDIADRDICLTHVDAVVGNPPYLRQEEIGQKNKARYYAIVREEWSGLKLSGRSDLHVYFWPHAASLLADGGYFGFLTSASWLDVEYGFHLQRWILTNFEIIGVFESICEPWFTGARVATAVTVLRRCNDSERRMQNIVRFVQLRKPLKELLEHDGTEVGRQEAVERLRNLIEKTTEHTRTNDYRILVIPQKKLWQDGCYLQRICRQPSVDEEGETETTSFKSPSILQEEPRPYDDSSDYLGSKWGVYLRAPDLYFELMERFGGAFVPLGEIAHVRYGFKSGCDDFFTPTDISTEALEVKDASEFRHRYRCPQQEVRTGKIRIVRAGDGSEHPIESKYLLPEVHSLMSIEGVRLNDQIKRVILLVNEPVHALKGTYVLAYLKYGERETFGGDTTVPNRDTCAGRPVWYDLTNYPTGRIILPIIVQYRHIVSWNPDGLPVNHALMAVDCKNMERNKALAAVLNSTLVAFIKPYFSRKLGNEANTQLDVYAANILPVPECHNNVGQGDRTARYQLRRFRGAAQFCN
jgi:Eco57I restriction-modification methylase